MKDGKAKAGIFALIGPGILVAATGVGAGDLATAAFSGNKLGTAVLWAVVLGAFLKYMLTEGLARWQLATGQTLLEGCMAKLGWPFRIAFFLYLIPWTFFVGSALMGACGATAHALTGLFDDASQGKLWLGIAHSVLGVALVRAGRFRLFERIMGVCIGVMFVTVVATAFLIKPDWSQVLSGLFIPRIPEFDAGGLVWTLALMGGVGGTLTVLCYGYWIREKGREGVEALRVCRLDLASAYIMTALFGLAMVIIGSTVVVEGKGAGLIVSLGDALEATLGPVGRWAFLLGAWGAVFSSLLGVWQSVPYVFADYCSMFWGDSPEERAERVSTNSRFYKGYLYAMAVVPIIALQWGFRDVQKYYAVLGACFIPFLAVVLLYLNGREAWVGRECKNKPFTIAVLTAALLLFAAASWFEISKKLGF